VGSDRFIRYANPGDPSNKSILDEDPAQVAVWDLTTRKELWRTNTSVKHLAFQPDSTSLICATEVGKLSIRDTRDGRVVATIDPPSHFDLLAVSRDGKYIATAAQQNLAEFEKSGKWPNPRPGLIPIRIWNGMDGRQEFQLPGYDRLLSIDFSPNGTKLLVAAHGGAFICNLSDGKPVLKFEHIAAPVSFSSDGRYLVTQRGAPAVWDATTGEMIKLRDERRKAFGTDRTVQCSDGKVQIYDVSTSQLLVALPLAGKSAFFNDSTNMLYLVNGGHIEFIEAAPPFVEPIVSFPCK
jgi:WD40 repeat protein